MMGKLLKEPIEKDCIPDSVEEQFGDTLRRFLNRLPRPDAVEDVEQSRQAFLIQESGE